MGEQDGPGRTSTSLPPPPQREQFLKCHHNLSAEDVQVQHRIVVSLHSVIRDGVRTQGHLIWEAHHPCLAFVLTASPHVQAFSLPSSSRGHMDDDVLETTI